jgi:3-mercaptopyruvate sulfurtransferase SseA
LGYTKVAIFYGGWLKWQNEKMPIDSVQATAQPVK